MVWDAVDCILTAAWQSTLITCPPIQCQIITKPSWITIRDSLGNYMYEGYIILSGATIEICPTDANTGGAKSDSIVLGNEYASGSISVSQYAPVAPPDPLIFEAVVGLSPLDLSGLVIIYPYGYGTTGSAIINISFVVFSPDHDPGDSFTMYYTSTKNGSYAGNGNFTVINNQSNEASLVLTSSMDLADVVVIHLASFYL
jgi:hypothetical protein